MTTTLDTVDATDGKRSLREAITAANATPEADTIVLPAGVFKIALTGAAEDSNATGDFDITNPVTIQGAGAGQTIIDAQQLDRVFDILGTAGNSMNVVLSKLQIRNGNVDGYGGGIQVSNANLTVRDAIITGNQATNYGGGVGNNSGTGGVTLVRTTVSRNSSAGGGGIYFGGDGNVIAIRDSAVRGNKSSYGGGINGGTVTVANSTISGNIAKYNGGGIDANKITATNSTFSGNSAGYSGGAIYGGTVTLNVCTVTGNFADRSAGIAAYRALTLNFCTVKGNYNPPPPTITVTTTRDVVNPSDGLLSLREAITRAAATPKEEVIVLPAGVFKLTRSGAGEDGNATGDLDITANMTIRGAGAGQTIIDGQQLDRVFDIRGTPSNVIQVVLRNLQVRNGKVTDNGGGIQATDANVTVRSGLITKNQAAYGGGIAGMASVTLDHSTVTQNVALTQGGGVFARDLSASNSSMISANKAGADGGGIYTTSSAYLSNSTISGNEATNGRGGGLFTENYATLDNSTASNNSAATGGGGVFIQNSAYMYSSTLSGNTAGTDGGGVFTANTLTLYHCTVNGNTAAANGGGIAASTINNLTNCTISANIAGSSGGGIFATKADLLNCTIVKNSAQIGGGVFHNAGDSFTVKNTIIALNLIGSGGSGPDVSGAFTTLGHNLIGINGGTGFTNGASGDIVGTSASPIDPLIGDLKNNGGSTMTHALLAGSPAIDAGDDVGSWPVTDQRVGDYSRKKDGNGDGIAAVDIGAFEK